MFIQQLLNYCHTTFLAGLIEWCAAILYIDKFSINEVAVLNVVNDTNFRDTYVMLGILMYSYAG